MIVDLGPGFAARSASPASGADFCMNMLHVNRQNRFEAFRTLKEGDFCVEIVFLNVLGETQGDRFSSVVLHRQSAQANLFLEYLLELALRLQIVTLNSFGAEGIKE